MFNTISLFSGAMGLDIGLEKAGLCISISQEYDKDCIKTIANNGKKVLAGDIIKYIKQDQSCRQLLELAGAKCKNDIFAIVGGPPCQSFSTMGKRLEFDDPRGQLVWIFFHIINVIRPRFFIMENVKGMFFSKNRNIILDHIKSINYHFVDGVLDAVNYGVPQFRERFIIIGSRDNEDIFLPQPTHFQLHQNKEYLWKTVGNVICNINEKSQEYVSFSKNRMKFLKKIPQGCNWKSLDNQDAMEAMGKAFYSGGGKTGFFRRLSLNEPSPTLVTSPIQKSTMLCHPNKNRPLSVQEYKRIQQFPDDWKIYGGIINKYKQIGNAVPINLGKALGEMLVAVSTSSSAIYSKRKKFCIEKYTV